ncbi:hypothetical protein Tco_1386678, partial [Tanacetum coccineum]
RKIAVIDQDPGISLVQHDVKIQGRYGHDKEVSTAEKDVSTAEPVSTAGATVTTVSVAVSTVSPTRNTGVSTANDITMAETMVYIRKSAVKDKGKGKMAESKTVQTKTKLQQEQERLDFEAAVRLQDELEEEERQRIVRAHEAASSFNTLFVKQQVRKVKTTFVPIESEGLPEQFPELANWEFKNAAKEELDQDSSRGKRW